MKKILSIAGIVLKLFFRGGAAWGLIFLTVALAVFMFFATTSDNFLVNELHLRIKYSLYASTALLNVALIYFSCITLRKDIDDRKFHNIVAAPVHRGQIWLGKFVGMLILAFIGFISISIAIGASCVGFVMNWENQEEVASLNTNFFRTYYACNPDLTTIEDEINTEYAKERQLLDEKQAKEKKTGEHIHDKHCNHDHAELEGEVWRNRKKLLNEVRKHKQIIAPGSEGRWAFKWDNSAVHGDYILLRFKFYANKRREKVSGVWSFANNSDWKHNFSGYPFLPHEIKIPVDVIKKTKTLNLVYTPEGSTYVIFPIYKNGITILYDSGGIFKNYLFLLLFSLAHMASLIAVSLMFSSLFSYSVAVFITTATYITGAFSSFFNNILTDLSFHDPTIINQIFSKVIAFGLWVTEGTKALPVNDMFADGISVPIFSLIRSDGGNLVLYLVAVCVIGTFALTKKEIDKILQK